MQRVADRIEHGVEGPIPIGLRPLELGRDARRDVAFP
jgi:hypothetical protein